MTIYQVCDTGCMGCCFCNHYFLNFNLFIFVPEGWLLYRIVFVSPKHQHEAAIDIHYFLPSQSHMVEMFERSYIIDCSALNFSLSYKLLKQTNKNHVCNKFPLWTSKYKTNILYIQKEGEIETSEEEWRGKEKHEFFVTTVCSCFA